MRDLPGRVRVVGEIGGHIRSEVPFLQGARSSHRPASPDPPLCRRASGRTHQLRQEEGVGDGEEQRDPQGHVGRGVAGGGRWVRGGHLAPSAWCPWLRSSSPGSAGPSNITSCPTHPSDVAWEGKKKVPAEQVLPLALAKRLLSEMRLRIRICIRWALARWGRASGHTEARRAGVSSYIFLPKEFLNPEHITPGDASYSHHASTLWPEHRRRQLAMTKTVC